MIFNHINVIIKVFSHIKRFLFNLYFYLIYNYKIIYLGNEYGGWDIIPSIINDKSVVYSFGIGIDTSFDEEMIKIFNCFVYAFDPTPKSIDYVESQINLKKFIFSPFGISDKDEIVNFYPPINPNHVSHSTSPIDQSNTNIISVELLSLTSILKSFNHNKIDVIKLDIEGKEYSVIDSILNSSLRPKQILVEFHPNKVGLSRHECIQFRKKILSFGYRMFSGSYTTSECSFVYKN